MTMLENLKQFFFATTLFVTALSVHWNFVGQKAHNESLAKQQSSKKIELIKSEQKLAYSTQGSKINL